ncbi:MAG TPA: ABC transporter ATP-binding protein [Pyrinomonadaceae bacterium]|jgi:ABC-2 type transport system ATP-binding protein|nr:ABC transporter ATP-binding protein [Pyrinomonadaceae bacterium]
MVSVIDVNGLRKTYGAVVAVDEVSFQVESGEIFGIVGPNGAGKTTTVECLEAQREPDAGTIRVLGLDPQRDGQQLRERIGVQLQEANLPDRLRVWEALDLYASFYRQSVDWEVLLDQLGLIEKRNAPFAKLSGGQKQRLFIALSLINNPEVVFLDELTTGLDPQARHAIWDLVRGVREQGKTIVLTTHFMEEAERLCDRVAVMNRGKIIALDTPRNLILGLKAQTRIIFEVDGQFDSSLLDEVAIRVERDGNRVVVYGKGDNPLSAIVQTLERHGCRFLDLRMEQPNLEDVFLTLTGDTQATK